MSSREIGMATQEQLKAYWRTNLGYIIMLLGVWFLASYVCGIFAVDVLDEVHVAGFKLGFWFANRGR